MKTTIKLLTLAILVTFSSCDKAKKLDYKFTESPKVLPCDFPNGDLYNEAIYSFENDIMNIYDMQNRNAFKAYSTFINNTHRERLDIKDIASEHSLKIAKALKEETNLWTNNNQITAINKLHPLAKCIENNIKDRAVKTTYNALLSTNSLKPSLILPLLNTRARTIQTDGSLKSFLALEYFYSKLLDIKLEDLKNPNPQPQPEPAKEAIEGVNFNKTR